MGPRAGLNGYRKLAPPGFDSRTVQSVASRYTDRTVPDHALCYHSLRVIFVIYTVPQLTVFLFFCGVTVFVV